MSIPTEVIMRMATLGLNEEQARVVADMLTAVEMATKVEADAMIERGRQKARDRMSKWRDIHKSDVTKRHVTSRDITQQLTGEGARVEDKTSNSEIEPQVRERNALTREFEQFWSDYPNKVGKPKALASFVAARKRAAFDAIMAGLRSYVASKPADRAWLNPTTFLNQDRWADQPAPVSAMPRAGPQRSDMSAVFGQLGDFLENGQGHGSGNHEAPSGVVLSLPVRAAQ